METIHVKGRLHLSSTPENAEGYIEITGISEREHEVLVLRRDAENETIQQYQAASSRPSFYSFELLPQEHLTVVIRSVRGDSGSKEPQSSGANSEPAIAICHLMAYWDHSCGESKLAAIHAVHGMALHLL